MNNKQNKNQSDPIERDISRNRIENRSSVPNDLPDSEKDARELESKEIIINIPDVKDIPGQEFVNTPPIDSLGDTTISSDDEEGSAIFDDTEENYNRTGNEADVSKDERRALEDITYEPTKDEDNLRDSTMDSTDFQGDPLNERSFGDERSGRGVS